MVLDEAVTVCSWSFLLRRGLRLTGIAGVVEVCFILHWRGGMRRIGVCAGVARWAERRMSGCFYNLVGMTKSTMVVVKSTY